MTLSLLFCSKYYRFVHLCLREIVVALDSFCFFFPFVCSLPSWQWILLTTCWKNLSCSVENDCEWVSVLIYIYIYMEGYSTFFSSSSLVAEESDSLVKVTFIVCLVHRERQLCLLLQHIYFYASLNFEIAPLILWERRKRRKLLFIALPMTLWIHWQGKLKGYHV